MGGLRWNLSRAMSVRERGQFSDKEIKCTPLRSCNDVEIVRRKSRLEIKNLERIGVQNLIYVVRLRRKEINNKQSAYY